MTKARTKGQKRRGRKRIENVPREPNGRISRRISETPDKVGLEARMRKFGIPADKARDQKAGSYIGYLNLLGAKDGLSDAQYEGAQSYLRLRSAHLRAIGAPGAIYDGEALAPASDPDAYAKWCQRTEEAYSEVRQAIQQAQNECRQNLWAALQYIIIEGREMPDFIGATRILCNALARHFGHLGENTKAA